MNPAIAVLIWIGAMAMVGLAIWIAVSARQRERAASQAAERAHQIKNEFVSMISHELRTPLTSIAGFASMLRESWRDFSVEEVEEFIDLINGQSEQLSELVEDLLVIPRLEAGRLRLFPDIIDFAALAHQVNGYSFIAPGVQSEASVVVPGGVRVFADPRRVQQVLRNLLDNAHKFGGDQILIEGAFMGEHYQVVVSDNGAGVPEEDVDRMFLHFEQLATGDSSIGQGAGLGLPIARQLARAMGGDVWYEKRFPTGCRFCFTIPVAPRTDAQEEWIDLVEASERG